MYRHINISSIYQYFGEDDLDLIREMIQIILTTNLTDLKDLPLLFTKSDFLSISKRCHKAKPTMSYIGALDTKNLLHEIEINPSSSENEIARLVAEIIQIEAELNLFLANLETVN